ncbi:MAG: hypothetical protein MJA84_15200, partial [Firmicutes bacterium]|nr:hypothetical protein [Bacillota bacterium]
LKKEIHPGDSTIPSNTILYQYDTLGRQKYRKDTEGTVDIYTYDNQGRILSQTRKREDGTEAITVSYRYDKNGNKRFETDGNNKTTEQTYDELNRLLSSSITVSGVLQTTQYAYDHNGNLTAQTDWRSNTWTNVYDPLNRLIEKRDPYTSIQKLDYNKNNMQVKSYDALNKMTQFTYDKNNRLLNTMNPENHATSQTYDDAGNVKTKKDGRNNVTTYEYDEFNRLQSVLNAKNETTSYTYDLNGNMLTQQDGEGNITTFQYNTVNQPVKKVDHGGQGDTSKTETYTYYASGSLKTKTDRNGKTTTYSYDCHKSLISQTVDSISISYTYDGNGNQLIMTDSTGTTERSYDELSRAVSKTVTGIGTTTFTYDIITGVESGHTAEISQDPKGNVTRKEYDKTGRLDKVTADGQTTQYEYYASGNRKSVTYPNQYKEVYTYYADNTLWTLTNKKADGSTMDSYTYTYDAANNQSSKNEVINGVSKGTTTYTYDSLNRLETVTEPDGKLTAYTFDAAGNRLTEEVTEGGVSTTTTYSYNEQNRLMDTETQKADSTLERTIYTYDYNGNMIFSRNEVIKPITGGERGIFAVYVAGENVESRVVVNGYDALNRLISTAVGDKTLTYAYNGEGRRVEKSVNGEISRYLYEYDKVILEVDGSGSQRARNVYGTNLLMREAGSETA